MIQSSKLVYIRMHFIGIYVSVQYELSLYCRELQLHLMQILHTPGYWHQG